MIESAGTQALVVFGDDTRALRISFADRQTGLSMSYGNGNGDSGFTLLARSFSASAWPTRAVQRLSSTSPMPPPPPPRPARPVVRLLWRALAAAALVLGLVGVVIPGLPTVPFLLVAAWAGGKGWPALEARLLAHPRHGPTIRRWRERGAIPRRAKWWASGMMLLSAGVLWLSALPLAARVGIPLFMAVVAAWMWTRPED